MEVFNVNLAWPEGTPKGNPHWIFVIAGSFEEALTLARASYPQARIRSVAQQSGPNNPVVPNHYGSVPIVIGRQEVS